MTWTRLKILPRFSLAFVCASLASACQIYLPTPVAANDPNGSAPASGALQPGPAAGPPVPIDPSAPMPPRSLGTNAQLTGLEIPATVMVDGRGDIFSSGAPSPDPRRGGVLPSAIGLVAGTGFVTVRDVRGLTGCAHDKPAAPPDGGRCWGGNTQLEPAGNVSGFIDHSHSQPLVGVFLGTRPGPVPPTLDFSNNESFAALFPVLGQTFYVGDGLTGSATGMLQKFQVPPGAVVLYLGYADGPAFRGIPGHYDDNTGGVSATVTAHR